MTDHDLDLGAHIPADVDAPDKVLYGLTFRQLAILAATAAGLWLGWRHFADDLPAPLLVAAGVVVAAVAVTVTLGRRDGLTLDRWLLSALAHARTPKRLAPATNRSGPGAQLIHTTGSNSLPAVLRLPATAVGADGVLDLGPHGNAAIVTVSTVNFTLRTSQEQAALIDAFGRWLNALPCPTQLLITARPLDLTARTTALHTTATQLPDPALAAMATEHADFLTDLATTTEPLARQILVILRDPNPARARHHAEDTAAALTRCGATCRVLDPTQVVTVLAHAVDPFRPGGLP
ncbi:PrgI family protein [Catellatospora sichuanensis]|uniref:PrgI family protein n=1 Tax=Catellatospora sichuanensis TaxID=1969805 RepID=UPI0011836069|nr:PrgI family protein [Catellatospora sichuanensis]